MNENLRILPRYHTCNMKIEFLPQNLEDKTFKVKNVSLGGLRIISETPVKFESSFKATLKLGSQEFELISYSVWHEAVAQEKSAHFDYGFRLVFSNEDHYRRWMTFMKALHQLKSSM